MHPEDIQRGSYVTVMRGPMVHSYLGKHENTNLNGDIFQVVDVDLPFVALTMVLEHNGAKQFHGVQVTLDTRKYKFKQIRKSFVRNVLKSSQKSTELKQPTSNQAEGAPGRHVLRDGRWYFVPDLCPQCGGQRGEHARNCPNSGLGGLGTTAR